MPAPVSPLRYSIFSVNDHYPKEPRTVPQLYEQVMRHCAMAEEMGYDTFFCAEHHFHEYGVVPDPAVLLSAIAQRTKRIRLGTAISILTFHDPRRIAETYSMVDMMSGGRLVFGVGSGYLKHEFIGYDANPAEKRDLFNENLDIVKRLMSGETLSYTGKFSKSEKVAINVLPHEGRLPPIHVAVLARDGMYHVGKSVNFIFTVPYACCKDFADIGNLLVDFRRGRAEVGLQPDDNDHIVTLHTYVARTDEEAKAHCKAAYDQYVETRLYAAKHVYEDIMKNGICLFGSVETVTQKVCQLYEMGVRHVATLHNFGGLQPKLVERSMALFANEVMPAVAARFGPTALAA